MFTFFEIFDRFGNGSFYADGNLDAGRAENLEGFRSAMAGEEPLGTEFCDRLCSLDSGSLCRIEVLQIVMRDMLAGFQIVNDEIGCSPKSRIDRRFERVTCRSDDDFQDSFSVSGC